MFSQVSTQLSALRAKGAPHFQKKWIVFLIVCISQLLDAMNITVAGITLTDIQRKYDTTYPVASWVMSAYALCFASFIMIMGRVGDIVGHHVTYIVGLFFLSITLLVTAVAQEIYVLIVFRAFQGVFASMTIPSSYAIVAHTFSGRELNLALATMTGLQTLAAGIGYVIGGAFYDSTTGYRGAFYLFFGLALMSSVLAFFSISHTPTTSSRLSRLDHLGVFVMLGGALLLVTGLTEGGDKWDSPKAYVPIVIGVLMISFFLLWETRLYRLFEWSAKTDLLIPHQVWKIPNFVPLLLILGLNYGSMFTSQLGVIQVFQYVSLNAPIISAVKTIAAPITVTFFAFAVGGTYGKLPPKYFIFGGLCLSIVSSVLFSRMGYSQESYWRFGFAGLILTGGGAITVFISCLNTLIQASSLDLQGLVSGIAITSAQFFVAASSAGTSSIIGNVEISTTEEQKKAMMKKYQHVFYFALALSGAAFLMNFLVKNVPLKPQEAEGEEASSSEPSIEKADEEIALSNIK